MESGQQLFFSMYCVLALCLLMFWVCSAGQGRTGQGGFMDVCVTNHTRLCGYNDFSLVKCSDFTVLKLLIILTITSGIFILENHRIRLVS